MGSEVCEVEHEQFPDEFRGLNKGQPNAKDLRNVGEFAQNLKELPADR